MEDKGKEEDKSLQKYSSSNQVYGMRRTQHGLLPNLSSRGRQAGRQAGDILYATLYSSSFEEKVEGQFWCKSGVAIFAKVYLGIYLNIIESFFFLGGLVYLVCLFVRGGVRPDLLPLYSFRAMLFDFKSMF